MAKVKLTQKQYNSLVKNRGAPRKGKSVSVNPNQYASPIGPQESRSRKVHRAVEGAATQFITSVGEFNRVVAPHVAARQSQKEPRGGGYRLPASRLDMNIGSGFMGRGFDYNGIQAHGAALHNMGGEWIGMPDFSGNNYLNFGSELLPAAKRRR
jgi:hypothetical protein